MLCPGCHRELIKLTVSYDGEKKEVWAHPDCSFGAKCEYKDDGLKVETEIIDKFMLDKFQELIQKEGISALNVVSAETKPDNISLIKTRLAKGELDIFEYLKVKEVLEN